MTLPLFDGEILTGKELNKNLIHETQEQLQANITTTESNVSFSTPKLEIIIANVGDNTAYINFDSIATTNDFPIETNRIRKFHGEVTKIHGITSTGTADLRIWGFGD